MWNLSILAYTILMILCVWGTARRYGTVVNPISYYAGLSGLQTVLAPALLMRLGLFDLHSYSVDDLARVILLSAVYSGFISLAFLVKWSPFFGALRWLSPKAHLRVRPTTYIFNACQFSAVFSILIVASGAGTLWFSNPRLAYQTFREGAGVWWSLCHASLFVAFACALFNKKRTIHGVFALCFFFCFLAYFLGSKGMMLGYFVLAAFYIEFYVRPLSKRIMVAICSILVLGAFGLQMVQGSASRILDTLEYFDYFTNTGMFLSDFDRLFGRAWGAVAISDLWSYVPRAIYPAKPHTYGPSSIMAVYYPNAAEASGATPGMLPWSASYWDFGIVGVAVNGLLTGLVARGAFDLFRLRPGIWTLLFLGQIGLLGSVTFYGAPFPVFLLWMFAQYACLKLISIRILPDTKALMRGDHPQLRKRSDRDPQPCKAVVSGEISGPQTTRFSGL
jgi:hypothetical protein